MVTMIKVDNGTIQGLVESHRIIIIVTMTANFFRFYCRCARGAVAVGWPYTRVVRDQYTCVAHTLRVPHDNECIVVINSSDYSTTE